MKHVDPRRKFICESCMKLDKPLPRLKCRDCVRIGKKAWVEANPEKLIVGRRNTYLKFRESIQKRKAEWQRLNPEKCRTYNKKYSDSNRPKIRAKNNLCRWKNQFGEYAECKVALTELDKYLKDPVNYIN